MMIPRWDNVKQALTYHHLFNTLLSIAFPVLRTTFLCDYVFPTEANRQCEIDSREREILMFLLIICAYKGRRATNWMHYVGNVFMFSKLAGMFLFTRADVLAGIVYIFACLVVTVLCPEPAYTGAEQITYFEEKSLIRELSDSRGTIFVIQFFTTWSPECKHLHPVFAELSEKFSLPNLKFGKLDVGRYPEAGELFRVNNHPASRQLPTVCVFRDSKEIMRRPEVKDRRAIPFVFSEDNCTLAFDLHNLYKEQKAKKAAKRAEKKND